MAPEDVFAIQMVRSEPWKDRLTHGGVRAYKDLRVSQRPGIIAWLFACINSDRPILPRRTSEMRAHRLILMSFTWRESSGRVHLRRSSRPTTGRYHFFLITRHAWYKKSRLSLLRKGSWGGSQKVGWRRWRTNGEDLIRFQERVHASWAIESSKYHRARGSND
jgi:hypothetical protein